MSLFPRICPTGRADLRALASRQTNCPLNDLPERSTDDRAPDPDRAAAPERQRGHGADRTAAEHRGGRRGVACAARTSAWGTRSRPGRSRPASRSSSTTRSSASPAEASRLGEHVHVHNVEMREFDRDYAFGADVRPTAYVPESERASFQGFLRANGKVGTRNYIGVLTTVNCSATVCHHVADRTEDEVAGLCRRRRRHRRAHPRHRLRHGRAGRGLGPPAADPLGLRPPPQHRRRADDRPRLRGQPDRLRCWRPTDQSRARFRSLDHAGARRHRQDHRAGAGDDRGDAAARQRGTAPRRVGVARSCSACSAAARTPSRA